MLKQFYKAHFSSAGKKIIESLSLRALLAVGLCAAFFSFAEKSFAQKTEVGIPWTGDAGVTVTVADLMAQPNANEHPVLKVPREHETHLHKKPNADAPEIPAYPYDPDQEYATTENVDRTPTQTIGANFLAPVLSLSGYIPPDNNGAAGPTQIMVVANGRIQVYSKTGVLGALNITTDAFFTSVLNGAFSSDTHIRYDRLSQRWFVVSINVPGSFTNNRVMIAVSSGPTITNTASFTFYFFEFDLAPPAGDAGKFLDYPTFGVDANALYIGGVRFNPNNFDGCPVFVVRKSSVLSGGPIVVTAFRNAGGIASGIYVPQGVDNDDPAATEGYFVGTDAGVWSTLNFIRVNNPGGVPSITTLTPLTVPINNFPVRQLSSGVAANRRLDGLDDRLFAAHIEKNKLTGVSTLWTAHATGVNSSGVASGTMDRNAARWYQIGNMTTTPTLVQSGTVFNNAATNPRGFWIPSIAMSGQGHAVLGGSTASAVNFADVFVAGRYSTDVSGVMQPFTLATSSSTSYLVQAQDGQRWGDYSQVVIDPNDNMTMWTFQEYCNGTNSWGERVVQLIAPAPPPAASLNSLPTVTNQPSVIVNIVANSQPNNTGFFDPGPDSGGPGFANRLTASVTGGIIVNSATFLDEKHVNLNLNTAGAAAGTYLIKIINPDGQFTSLPITVTAAAVTPVQLISFTATEGSNDVLLNWSTMSEINSDYFTLEKSPDALRFIEEATIPAAGYSDDLLNYSFTDKDPFRGTSFYRLRLTDLDGSAIYSNVVTAYLDETNFNLINAVSNAQDQTIHIYFYDDGNENIQYELTDALGRTITQHNFSCAAGKNEIIIDASSLSAGIYLVAISNGKEMLSGKVFY